MKLRVAKKVEHLVASNFTYYLFNGRQFIHYRNSTVMKAKKRVKKAWTRRMS